MSKFGYGGEVYIDPRKVEPVPPKASDLRIAGHHWLDNYDCDGHYFGQIVLQ